MRFKIWLENEDMDIDSAQTSSPASAEVIKTGLQPQVDAKEIHTKQKDEHDKLMAIDGHMQRIQQAADTLNQTPKQQKLKAFCKKISSEWEKVKSGDEEQEDAGGLGGFRPSPKQIDYMKNNQPLPNTADQFTGGSIGGW